MSKNFLITVLLVAGIFLTAGISATLAQNSSRTLSISSAKNKQDIRSSSEIVADVSKSGTVYFHASGYQTFEPVTLSIETADTQTPIRVLVAQWQAVANENGGFDAVWFSGTYDSRMLVTAAGQDSGSQSEAIFYVSPNVVTATASLDQCANGPVGGTPVVCSGTAWQNGNLNQNQAHYMEGESVPYRLSFIGMAVGSTNTVTIEWDAMEGGHHALDYLTTFNESETGADPCTGVPNCTLPATGTYAIPVDPTVAAGFDGIAGTADDITQLPGVFTIYGGDITLVSGYTTVTSGSKVLTSITITFTANKATPVLAWGGHIATRMDWGVNHSAIALSGSPYHMRLLDVNGSGGNQDRSLSSDAAVFPGQITIIKSTLWHSVYPFNFTATGPGVAAFTIYDYPSDSVTYPNSKKFSKLTAFAPGNTISISETPDPNNYFTLADIQCAVDPNGGAGTIGDIAITFSTGNVAIDLVEGEYVTCTYYNTYLGPTAANVTVAGRVTDQNGFGVRNAAVYLAPMSASAKVRAISNPFGYYQFADLPAGQSYVVSVSAKGYTFNPSSLIVTPTDNVSDLNFQGYR